MADPYRLRRDYAAVNLDRRVVWGDRMEERDSMGNLEVTFTDHDVWAKRIDASDAVSIEGQDLVRAAGEIRYLVRFGTFAPRDKITDGGKVFLVNNIEEIGRRRWMLLSVREAN